MIRSASGNRMLGVPGIITPSSSSYTSRILKLLENKIPDSWRICREKQIEILIVHRNPPGNVTRKSHGGTEQNDTVAHVWKVEDARSGHCPDCEPAVVS